MNKILIFCVLLGIGTSLYAQNWISAMWAFVALLNVARAMMLEKHVTILRRMIP